MVALIESFFESEIIALITQVIKLITLFSKEYPLISLFQQA